MTTTCLIGVDVLADVEVRDGGAGWALTAPGGGDDRHDEGGSPGTGERETDGTFHGVSCDDREAAGRAWLNAPGRGQKYARPGRCGPAGRRV